ncbi:MAG: TRAP transporter substrate-binding protein [Clostridiales bacterium]|nr:TRAP transporter substrate-binding protein [Clostridiales bacterium]
MRLNACRILAACALISLSGCNAGGQKTAYAPEFVFTYAENQAEGFPTVQGARRFASLVNERTDGRIEILVYPDASLGEEQSIIEQMQFGGIDFTRASLTSMSEFVQKYNVLQLPYLYKDSAHMWRVLDGEIGRDFLAAADGSGLTALAWYDAGARSFYTCEKPIRTLEDVAGMRLRVQESAMMSAMIEALGGIAAPMPYEDVYSALQTGVIDGAENNFPSFESTRHYETAKYFTVNEHTRVPELQLISTFTWNKLSPGDREIIRACAEESARYERELWREREKVSEETVRNNGCEIIRIPERERERFMEAVLPVYMEFCSEYMDIIDEIKGA